MNTSSINSFEDNNGYIRKIRHTIFERELDFKPRMHEYEHSIFVHAFESL